MNDIWHSFLNKMGAVFDGNTVTHFGNPDRERLAALESNIVADLSTVTVAPRDDCWRCSGSSLSKRAIFLSCRARCYLKPSNGCACLC